MMKKILVPIDGSEPSKKAFDYALEVADKCGGEIAVLSVVPPVLVPILSEESGTAPYITASEIERVNRRMTASFDDVLSEALAKARNMKPNLKVRTMLEQGRPGDRIVEVAKKGEFDLIIMGSRGLSGLSEFILGSTTHHVADNCTCPLLIIK